MSKGGGAGKVYFVLYLAVVLELLIIIVERDEAEEGLHKKQQETMRIVESILSQLQSGAGTEGINTRPQDEITVPPSGINLKEVLGTDIKAYRKYIVEVGVTDVTSAIKRKEGESEKDHFDRLKKLVELANVADIEYQIFYNNNTDPTTAPVFLNDEEIKRKKIDFATFQPGQSVVSDDGTEWTFMGLRKLTLDKDATFNNLNLKNLAAEGITPIYPRDKQKVIGPNYSPNEVQTDSIFYYSENESRKVGGKGLTKDASGLQKRAFVVYFQPPSKEGWYKLRFASRTNRILGVRADQKPAELNDDATVNIGTVQLTVSALRKVQKAIFSQLEKYELPTVEVLSETDGLDKFETRMRLASSEAMKTDNAVALKSKIDLYGYIAKLLAPGQSVNFDQNKGAIEFNVRVITPQPRTADPVVRVAGEIHRFDKAKVTFMCDISPYQNGQNKISGRVYNEAEGFSGAAAAELQFEQISGENGKNASYRVTVDRELAAGANGGPRRYLIKLNHSLMSKTADTTAVLTIYPAVDGDKNKEMEARFEGLATYGNQFFFNYTPPSGNKILPEQFGYYFKLDSDPQERDLKAGLAASRDDNLTFAPQAKTAKFRVVWRDPVTNQELDIFPEKTVQISQAQPVLLTNNAQENIGGSDDRINVRVTGITIRKPETGAKDQEAKVSIEAGNPSVRVSGYKMSGKPSVSVNKDGSVSLEFSLVGQPQGDGYTKGTVDIPLTITATNPVNGAQSKPFTKPIKLNIRKKIDMFDAPSSKRRD